MKRTAFMMRVVGLLAIMIQFSACAGSKALYSWKTTPKDREALGKYRMVLVVVQAKDGVKLIQDVQERLGRRITEYFKTEYGDKYIPVTTLSAGPGTLGAQVSITRYDDGIAFAQYVFSGQVRMRIDGEVTLSDWQTKERLAEFNVSKSFEWESIYGKSIKIDDPEPDFAQGVVAGIAQEDQ
jgi:hypothetical protein